jgi:hypothetical protein
MLDIKILGIDGVILEPFNRQRHLQAERHIDLSNKDIEIHL